MNIKAVIFDMDDLLINSHPTHMLAFEKVLNSYGRSFKDDPLSAQEEAGFFGMKVVEIVDLFKKRYNIIATIEEFQAKYAQEVIPAFQNKIEEMPGARETVKSLNESGYLLALASSAIRNKIDIILKHLQIESVFKTIVSGEDVSRGKPDPEIFLNALERLKEVTGQPLHSQECLVIEDAANGIESAINAKMKCIGVHNQPMYQHLGIKQDLSKADFEVESLEEITPEIINKIE
ncbi:HAD family phosphatase [Patescibacteria group bacterium]|nr:HAD family phosphatase [Patescibacteria group bacterium]MBU1890233.1 HAD family phosphatase [Patescibacteria group bacterium]